MNRCLSAFQWSLVHGSPDVGDLAFTNLQWQGEFVLVRNTRKKTPSLAVFPSVLQWEYDSLHCLATQLSIDWYNAPNRVFCHLNTATTRQDDMSAHMNRVLQSLSGTHNVTPQLKPHSNRRRSTVVAASGSDLNMSDLIHRGRWTMDVFHTPMDYIPQTSSTDQKNRESGLRMGDSADRCSSPKARVYHTTDQLQRASSRELFHSSKQKVGRDAFVNPLAATPLRYVEATYSLAPQHIPHHTTMAALQSVGTALN